jgi:hypothetical protein
MSSAIYFTTAFVILMSIVYLRGHIFDLISRIIFPSRFRPYVKSGYLDLGIGITFFSIFAAALIIDNFPLVEVDYLMFGVVLFSLFGAGFSANGILREMARNKR